MLSTIVKRAARLAVICLLLVSVAVPVIPVHAETPHTINGNTVSLDTADIALSVTPHTLASSGWVEFSVLSKNYAGDLDLVWQLDGVATVMDAEWWTEDVPHDKFAMVEVEREGTLKVTDVTTIAQLEAGSQTPDIGNANNPYLARVFLPDADKSPVEGESVFDIAYTTLDDKNEKYTFTYNYTTGEKTKSIDYYDDWKKAARKLEKVGLTASLQTEADIVPGSTYTARAWIEIPFAGNGIISGKYDWGVKPSGLTIEEAEAAGQLWMIDPWYDTTWLYRTTLTFDNSASAEDLVDFPVLLYFDNANFDFTQAEADGADLRFTDSDGETLLEYLIDDWDDVAELGTVWVKVPQIDAGSTTDHIYVYWGNAGATSIADEERVFGDWSTVSNCEDGVGWTTSATGGSSVLSLDGTVKQQGTYSIKTAVTSVAAQTYDTTYDPDSVLNFSADGSTVNFWFRGSAISTNYTSSRIYLYDGEGDYLYWDLTYAAAAWTEFTKFISEPDGSLGIFDTATVDYVKLEVVEDGAAANFDYWVDQIEEINGAVFVGVYSGSTNTLLNDATRYSNNGTFKGAGEPAWAQDANGLWWLAFDGANDYISVGNPDVLRSLGGAMTATSWIDATSNIVVSHYDYGTNQRAWYMTRSAVVVNALRVRLSDDGSAGAGHWKDYTGSVVVYDGTPHMTGFRWGASTLDIINDGAIDPLPTKTADDAISTLHHSTANVMLGCYLNTGVAETFLAGDVTCIIITNYAQSADWIEAGYLSVDDSFVTFGTGGGGDPQTKPLAPTGFTATVIDSTTIRLDWTNGSFADSVELYASGDGLYPSLTPDGGSVVGGVLIYSGAAATYDYTPADTDDVTYRFGILSVSEYGYADDMETASAGGELMTAAITGIGDAIGECLVLISLLLIPLGLTFAMFYTRQMLLGFPCVMFWGILGGYAKTLSTTTWDIYYFTFFASFGMVIFSALAMYALRTQKQERRDGDEMIDETDRPLIGADNIDRGDTEVHPEMDRIKVGNEYSSRDEDEGYISPRRRAIRERAARRRSEGIQRPSTW